MFGRRKFEREMDAELRHHLELLEAEYVARGMSPEEAVLAARRDFGGVAKTAEAYREQRGIPWMETAWRDLRFAFRSMRRAKALAGAVIVTLALGIGANTAIFSVIRTVQFKPLPYPDADRLVWVTATGTQDQIREWHKSTQAYEALAFVTQSDTTLIDGTVPLEVDALNVSQPLSRVLGVKIALGRDFMEEEVAQNKGAGEAVLISYRLFQERYAGDPGVLGREVSLSKGGRGKHVIAGVLSPDFRLALPRRDRNIEPDIIINMGTTSGFDASPNSMGRLKPGVSPQAAEAELTTVFQDRSKLSRVVTLQEYIIGRTRAELLVLWFAVSCVLLIACVNVTNLLLARSTTRAREGAVRAALGASRFALVRQSLVEITLLSFCGGAVGLGLAWMLIGLFANKGPIDVPRLREAGLDWWVVMYCVFCCLITGLISGLGPALTATRHGILQVLRRGEGTSSASWSVRLWHRGLAGAQVAVALMLLVGAGLLVKTLWVMRSASSGVEPEQILIGRVEPSDSLRRDSGDISKEIERQRAVRLRQLDELLRQVGLIPGVRRVALSMPLNRFTLGTGVEGAVVNWQVPPSLPWAFVTPEYFSTAGYRLSAGRFFDEHDVWKGTSTATVDKGLLTIYPSGLNPVIIVNEAFLRTYAAGMSPRDALNRRTQIPITPKNRWPLIVGVVHDLSLRRDVAPEPQIFWALAQTGYAPNNVELVVRAAGDPMALTGLIRKMATSGGFRMFEAETLAARISAATATRDFEAQLLSAFAAVALLLAMVGVYGVLNYAVAQRMHEIGVRMALGANRRDVLGLVLREGMLLAVGGTALGVAGAWGMTRWMSSMLYGVQARDPWIFWGGGALMLTVACLAAYWPARRATRVDPMVALRQE